MVIVLASARVKEGQRDNFLKLFKAFAETVRKEKGCIEYFPTIDQECDLLPQVKDANIVTVIEKWESMLALQEHLQSADMKAFGQKSESLTEGMSAKVLRQA